MFIERYDDSTTRLVVVWETELMEDLVNGSNVQIVY